MFFGHWGLWFFILILLMVTRLIKVEGKNILPPLILFSFIFAIPSCSVHYFLF